MSDDLIERLRGPVKQAALDLIDVYFGNSRKILATIPADESRDADLLLVKGIKEAADELDTLRAENERLRAAIKIVRREMNTKANGGVGWMAEFEALATLKAKGDGKNE